MFVNERAPKPVLPTWGQTLDSQTLMARQRDALSELELDLELGTRDWAPFARHDHALCAMSHCACLRYWSEVSGHLTIFDTIQLLDYRSNATKTEGRRAAWKFVSSTKYHEYFDILYRVFYRTIFVGVFYGYNQAKVLYKRGSFATLLKSCNENTNTSRQSYFFS